jgi:hypothetical protein
MSDSESRSADLLAHWRDKGFTEIQAFEGEYKLLLHPGTLDKVRLYDNGDVWASNPKTGEYEKVNDQDGAPCWAFRNTRRKTMMALGLRTSRTATTGHSIISLRVGNGWRDWSLGNQIPEGQPDFGVFEFVPDGQFCYWRDVQLAQPNEWLDLLSRAAEEIADMRGNDDPITPIELDIKQALRKP